MAKRPPQPNSKRYHVDALLAEAPAGGIYSALDSKTGESVLMRRFFDAEGAYCLTEAQEKAVLDWADRVKPLAGEGLGEILDSGKDDEGVFVIEAARVGSSLKEALAEGGLPKGELDACARQVLAGLARLHEANLCLGSLDASSIHVAEQGEERFFQVTDYGWERVILEATEASSSLAWIREPELAAPEIIMGEEVNVLGDLYSFGQLIFLAAAGKHPMAGLRKSEALIRHLSSDYGSPDQERDDLDANFVSWIMSFLAITPTERPASAAIALEALSNGEADPIIPQAELDDLEDEMGTPKESAIPVGTQRLDRHGPQAEVEALDLSKDGLVLTPSTTQAGPTASPAEAGGKAVTPAATPPPPKMSKAKLVLIFGAILLISFGAILWKLFDRAKTLAEEDAAREQVIDPVEKANQRAKELMDEALKKQ